MIRLTITVLLSSCLLQAFAQSFDEAAIRQVLSEQQTCWNNGDLECYMEGYWKSENLLFIGSKGVTYGWEQTLQNYKESYPTHEEMGILSLDVIQMEPLSDDFWSVVGRWKLERGSQADKLGGHFTLIFRRLGNDWVIVSDHSS